jgi:DNA-3-methyladenine glycosylase I
MYEIMRCRWAKLSNPLYVRYHDEEWGVPLHDDRALFELLNLEGAQAGLSWETILKKRENYRRAFDHFDAHKMARYTKLRVEKLLRDEGIVRNRLKVEAFCTNARAYLKLKEQGIGFDQLLWKFTDGKPKINHWKKHASIPSETKESDAMSKELKRLGFKFVGSTICYAFMQASGMVDDHVLDCFKRSR